MKGENWGKKVRARKYDYRPGEKGRKGAGRADFGSIGFDSFRNVKSLEAAAREAGGWSALLAVMAGKEEKEV